MSETKELNIKNQTYYFLDDMIDIRNFHSKLLKINKKPYKDVNIYYIGYITIKKFSDCENIHSFNPLYLIFHFVTGHFKEKYGEKYLIIDSTEKCKKVFSGIISEIKTMVENNCIMEKIEVNTDDDLPLNKPLKFPTLTIRMFVGIIKMFQRNLALL